MLYATYTYWDLNFEVHMYLYQNIGFWVDNFQFPLQVFSIIQTAAIW